MMLRRCICIQMSGPCISTDNMCMNKHKKLTAPATKKNHINKKLYEQVTLIKLKPSTSVSPGEQLKLRKHVLQLSQP